MVLEVPLNSKELIPAQLHSFRAKRKQEGIKQICQNVPVCP